MWQVENLTPFPAAGDWVRDRDGAEVWVVAVRCTFRIERDGTTSLDDEQDPPVLAPKYRGDPAHSSLLYDSDFFITKPTTDVLLHGHAYAPEGVAVSRVDVTMRVGEVSKTLRVTGDRLYSKSVVGAVTESAQRFARLPITYERAYGGQRISSLSTTGVLQYDARNPIGSGFAPVPGTVAPNVEKVGGESPAGFGPIPSHWQPRVKYAGTYDETWRRDRMPLYPSDLDERFFLCSPEDQRPAAFLRGGELVDLINLTPDGRTQFLLPRLAFRFETEFRGKPPVVHRGRLHTVILEPDIPRIIMVWQTALRAHADVLRLMQTSISQLTILNPQAGSIPLSARTLRLNSRG